MPAFNPITVPLPADLPTTWQPQQIVAPNGADAGLAEQYGYNYLMEQVNAAQQALQELGYYIPQLAAAEDIGGYFIIPAGESLPPSQRQQNTLYGQIIDDFTQSAQIEGGAGL